MKKTPSIRSINILAGIVAGMLLIFTGCRTSQQKQEGTTETAEEQPQKEAVIEELSGYPLPTAFEITELINEAGAPYILTLSNEPGKAGDYITQKEKALNLGMYGTDLCYAATYMMKQATMQFLEATRTLIDELGISTTFNVNYAERIENNLDNRDSLIMIVSDSFYDTWDYLVKNQQDILARLVVSGSWIEGIYVTTNIAQTSRDNTKFLKILANQKTSLSKLIALLEPVKDAEEITGVITGLYGIQDIYEQMGETMTDEQLEEVAVRIETLRNSIV
jgi:hypothetical protein